MAVRGLRHYRSWPLSRAADQVLTLAPSRVQVNPWHVGLLALVGLAFALRWTGAEQQSAYMDEGTNVLTGRLLIEQHTVYAEILNWAYGSYLWPLLAGLADGVGGLRLVRGLTAVCGVVMVMATAGLAATLAPRALPASRRWAIALLAGSIMALAPTAIGVGRFGTYDAFAAATFMAAVTLLLPVDARRRRTRLLAAAALLFLSFLAKYLVAIYFPFICVYVVLSAGRRLRLGVSNALWFAAPLAAACLIYLLVFLGPLLTLLASSLHYGDLKSPDPLREYVWTRPELWVLLVVAALGWRSATWPARLVAAGGTAVIMAFQVEARPDFDFWKHSVYVLYFLAPLAALTWLRVPQNTGSWKVVAALGAALAALWAWTPAIQQTDKIVNFYPNLNTAMAVIDAQTQGAALVLTDDTALRYYLFPRMSPDHVVGPFFFTYRAQDGVDAYKRAVADRFFDAIVLDGGVTPQGNAIRAQVGSTIDQFYQRVYAGDDGLGFSIEIYKPVRPQGALTSDDATPWPVAYTFDAGVQAWGAHPEASDWQPGLLIEPSTEQPWEGLPSLRFAPSDSAATISVRAAQPAARVRARLYVERADGSSDPVRVGFMAFDDSWQWHDDAFRWQVPTNAWTTITWDLPQPGEYQELGLKFPSSVSVAYVGSFEVQP